MHKQYIQVGHRQIHVVTAGDQGPWVVLHHESPLSWQVWQPAIGLLTEHFRVIMPDTPGYGNSDAGTPDWEIQDYAATLLQAIKGIVGDDAFAVVGCHTGASIALEIALQGSAQVDSAIFLGLPAYDPKTRADRLQNWAPSIGLQEDGSHLSEVWDRYTRIWTTPTLEHKNRAVLDVLNVLERYNWGYLAAFRYDPVPALKNLEQRILFLTAEYDALAEADRRCAELVDAEIMEIPGLHGQVPAKAPEVLTRELKRFLVENHP